MEFGKRLKELRLAKGVNQAQIADLLGLKRSAVSNYEAGNSFPKLEHFLELVKYFDVASDYLLGIADNAPQNAHLNAHLITKDKMNRVSEGVHLSSDKATDARRLAEQFNTREVKLSPVDPWGTNIKDDIIVATQDTEGNPTFSLINYKAAANYLTGYQSQEYYSNLAPISLPRQLVGNPRQGIVLQIEGDSMTPRFQHGDYVAAILLDRSEWGQIRDLDCYVVVSHSHGIQFKRIKNRLKQFGFLRCKSDNRRHTPYNIEEEDLIQLFRFVLHISPDASNTDETLFNKVESIEERVEDQRDMYEQLAQRMEDMQQLLQQQLPPATK